LNNRGECIRGITKARACQRAMECFYINLDRAPERRRFVEGNFRQHKAPGWFLTRIAAVNRDDVSRAGIHGKIGETEKACHLSHRNAIAEAIEAPGHVMILEDDVLFGPHSCAGIEHALAQMPDGDWDVMFSDLSITDPRYMAELLQTRRELVGTSRLFMPNLKTVPHCGATAYIINERYKGKLHALVNISPLDVPYDILLRWHVMHGETRGFMIFPFPTSLSAFADASQIEAADRQNDVLWNAYRRFVWADRDFDSAVAKLRELGCDFLEAD